MRTLGENHEAHSEAQEGTQMLAHEMHLRALGVLDGAPKL